jgi:hypothetical protein
MRVGVAITRRPLLQGKIVARATAPAPGAAVRKHRSMHAWRMGPSTYGPPRRALPLAARAQGPSIPFPPASCCCAAGHEVEVTLFKALPSRSRLHSLRRGQFRGSSACCRSRRGRAVARRAKCSVPRGSGLGTGARAWRVPFTPGARVRERRGDPPGRGKDRGPWMDGWMVQLVLFTRCC